MKKASKKYFNRGITLVSLVVTIIVLIILAGISINMILGKNGIITIAKLAKENMELAQIEEQERLNELYTQIEKEEGILGEDTIEDLIEFKKVIATAITSRGITTSETDTAEVMAKNIESILTEDKINDLIDAKIKNVTTPTGSIIAQMGNVAPDGYLFCDGTEYNISDYKTLADYIKTQFGSYNYWGGNGTTTFAVPDLRGEFLRGTGTASRNEGSGTSVGAHQNATVIPTIHTRITADGRGFIWFNNSKLSSNNDAYTNYMDKGNINRTTPIYQVGFASDSNNNATEGWGSTSAVASYTTRPTNTSVLYCIKY